VEVGREEERGKGNGGRLRDKGEGERKIGEKDRGVRGRVGGKKWGGKSEWEGDVGEGKWGGWGWRRREKGVIRREKEDKERGVRVGWREE